MVDNTVIKNSSMINGLTYNWDESLHQSFSECLLGRKRSFLRTRTYSVSLLKLRLENSLRSLQNCYADCDKRIAALAEDFCVTCTLQELSKATSEHNLFQRVQSAQSIELRILGFIDDFNDILNKSESSEFVLRYNFDEIITSVAKYVIDTFLSIFRLLETLEWELMTVFYPEWSANLFSIGTGTSTKNQNFIVSAFRNTCDALSSYYAISASLISKEHPALYQNRKYGYLYHPTKEQIIGMAPSDLSLHDSHIEECAGMHLLNFNPLDNLLSAIFGDIKLSSGVDLRGNFSDFQRIYNFAEFKRLTKDYNEIILREDTAPIAIFTTKDSIPCCNTELFSMCTVAQLPLVIFGADQTTVIPLHDIAQLLK